MYAKEKLKLSHYTPRSVWGERKYSSYSFSTSALDRDECQRHAPAALHPRERTPGTQCTGGWVGSRAGLDTEARGKILCLCCGSTLDRPVVQPVARYYTAWATRLTQKKRSRVRLEHVLWTDTTSRNDQCQVLLNLQNLCFFLIQLSGLSLESPCDELLRTLIPNSLYWVSNGSVSMLWYWKSRTYLT
jgi:hypothetical protein